MDRYQQAAGTTAERSGERVVVLDADGTTMTTLNATGAVVWEALSTPTGMDGLTAALQAAHPEVGAEQLAEDAAAFVDELQGAGLIVTTDAAG